MSSTLPPSVDATTGDPGLPGGTHHATRLVERQAVLIGVLLESGGARWVPGRVTDISSEGCRLVTLPGDLLSGMAVQVMFPGFAGRAGAIIWAQEDQAGCRFDAALHPAILDYIIRMSDPIARG